MAREIDFRYGPDRYQTCIGRVDDEYKTLVHEDGSVTYGFGEADDLDSNDQLTVNQGTRGFRHRIRPRFDHNDEFINRTQEFGDPNKAIVTTTEEYEETTFEWTTFSYADKEYTANSSSDDSSALRADVIRWTLSTDPEFGHAQSDVYLELNGSGKDLPEIISCIDAPESSRPERWQSDLVMERSQSDLLMQGGTLWEGAFLIIHEGEFDKSMFTVNWTDEALTETRKYWNNIEPFQNELSVPDDEVNDMLTACGRNILQAREVIKGVREYQVGPTHYRGYWIVDGHFLLEAAQFMGRNEQAFQQGLIAIQRRVKPSGAIQDIPHHEKETGIAMATIVRQCELADEDERLIELWPTLKRGLEYLKKRHQDAADREESYPASQLFPPTLPDGGISGPVPEYTTPLWILAGVKYAASAGERLELEGHEDFWEFFREIRAGFESCAERDLRETEEGIPYIPMNMIDRDYDNPQSATWAFAHAIYPGEVFDPDSDYVKNLLSLLESVEVEEIPAETGWIHDQGIWSYSAMFYAQAFLYAGRPEKAIDYLYGFANHAAPSRVWREEQPFRESHSNRYVGDMPHNWASAEFIRLVRNLLVFERKDQLELLPGLPSEWLPNDQPVVVSSTPTKFGEVSLEFHRAKDGFELTYERDSGNKDPQGVSLTWDGEVYGDAIVSSDGETHHIDPDLQSVTIRCQR